MNMISSSAGILCTCTIACVLIKMLVPNGSTRKTMNLIITAFLILILISPIKNLFEKYNGFNVSTPDEARIISEYDSRVLSLTKENLRKSLSRLLDSYGISHGKIFVTLKKDNKNSIIIDCISIYISDSSNTAEIIRITEENFGITPEIIME